MQAHDEARRAFQIWEQEKPANFFAANPLLQHVLQHHLPADRYRRLEPELRSFGETCAQVIDPLAAENDRIGNHPQLRQWNEFGERCDAVVFHPSYHELGRAAWASGILQRQASLPHAFEQAALFYLLSHCGEMGHACPIACTSGLIRALQHRGSPALQERYLPGLLSNDYDQALIGAQFVTEIQGGSDVGANACVAVPVSDEEWRLSGEKWFCSVANADLFLVSARPRGAAPGTAGLGAFLVPRRLEGGRQNSFTIRRLKEKFGTRTLATAEIDFHDAVAYLIGRVDEGFKIIIEMVLNVSRWYNALGSCGLMQRAYYEAATFARHRCAFGDAIIRYPLVQEALAEIRVSAMAGLLSTLYLTRLIDRLDTGQASEEERACYRLLVNINKYTTSVAASLALRRAQELLGGNGAVETFSVVPRLYRDSVVYESWEGSHNVLCLQVLRDCRKYGFHEALFSAVAERLSRHQAVMDFPVVEFERFVEGFRRLLQAPEPQAQLHIRRAVDRLTHYLQAALLMEFVDSLGADPLAEVLQQALMFFVGRCFQPGYRPEDDPDYQPRIQVLATRDDALLSGSHS